MELARKEVTEGFCFIYCYSWLWNVKKMNNGDEFLWISSGFWEIRARSCRVQQGRPELAQLSVISIAIYSAARTVVWISPTKCQQCSWIPKQHRYRTFGQQLIWVLRPDVMQWFSTSPKVKSSLPLKCSLHSLLNMVCGTERAGDYCFTTESNVFALFIKYSCSNQEKATHFVIQLGP